MRAPRAWATSTRMGVFRRAKSQVRRTGAKIEKQCENQGQGPAYKHQNGRTNVRTKGWGQRTNTQMGLPIGEQRTKGQTQRTRTKMRDPMGEPRARASVPASKWQNLRENHGLEQRYKHKNWRTNGRTKGQDQRTNPKTENQCENKGRRLHGSCEG